MSRANIFIGCGGSGIRSLTRLSSLLAEDADWRNRAATDVFFIALDTEEKMLVEFKQTVQSHFRGSQAPFCKTHQMSAHYSNLGVPVQDLFIRPFAKGGNPEGLRRLHEHWWFNTEQSPFQAPWVRPLSQGAGQVPAVSYFLAWMRMHEIEEIFEELREAVTSRRAGPDTDKQPMEDNNLIIVSGLAGGTGRGCWNLLSFKFQQMCQDDPRTFANPVGFFVDVSCFEDVTKRKPRQALKMHINSLTGLSELSTWMRQARAVDRKTYVQYQLPDMGRPQDPASDVLRVNVDLGDPTSVAPVSNAYLIFRNAANSLLRDSKDAFSMVGTALYAKITKSQIDGEAINEASHPYWGVGTATFEIPADSLRRYFEWDIRVRALESFARTCTEPALSTVREFCREHALIFRAEDLGCPTPDPEEMFFQKVFHHLTATGLKDRMEALHQALNDDDLEMAHEATTTLLTKDEPAARAAVEAALHDIEGTIPIPQRLRAALFEGEHSLLGREHSVLGVKAALEGFIAELRQQLSKKMPLESEARPPEDIEPHEEIEKSKRPEYFFFFGKRFNAGETARILQEARQVVQYEHYGAVLKAVQAKITEWESALRPHLIAADALTSAFETLGRKFRGARDSVTPGESDEALFTSETAPEESILPTFDPGRFFRRVLKPIKVDVQHKIHFASIEARLAEILRNERNEIGSGELEQGAFRAQLELQLIRDVSPTEDVMKDYTFPEVIKRLRKAWLVRFDQEKNRGDAFALLKSRFEQFFGVRVALNGQRQVEMTESVDQFIWAMGASLVATCQPYWKLAETGRHAQAPEYQQVLLFVPTYLEPARRSEAETYVRSRVASHLAPTLQSIADRAQGNPFLMLAYASEATTSLDNLRSLKEWNSDPSLKEWLQKCEQTSGASIFDATEGDMGSGFTDPIYVRNAVVSSHRWKPWVSGELAAAEAESEVLDALTYALLEPTESVASQLAAAKWTFPVIARGEREVFTFHRRAFKPELPATADLLTPWQAGDRVQGSIGEVFAFLAGRGPALTAHLSGAECRARLLGEARYFWETLARENGFSRDSPEGRRLLRALAERVDSQAATESAEDRAVWRRLLQRVNA